MALDLQALWDFSDPVLSEQRFRDALAAAGPDDTLILQTQIARSLGLRREFDQARAVLGAIVSDVPTAGPEARIRYQLELGRTYASSTHAPGQRSDANNALARLAFETALASAREAGLDGLAIDAIHMMAFVDVAPASQVQWAESALAVVLASTQADAQRWEPSIRHNLGYGLHQLERYEDALEQFRLAVALREAGTNVTAVRVGWWMVAWTLRALHRVDEALEIQLRLERENEADGTPDSYVFEELETLYGVKGEPERAAHYAGLRAVTA